MLGEGLLSESGDGRDGSAARHGVHGERDCGVGHGVRGDAGLPLHAHGPQGDQPPARRAQPQEDRPGDGRGRRWLQIPAGFTYLGQFIDHDLTFDKTLVDARAERVARAAPPGRSPSLDLDALYGAPGRRTFESAKFYSDDRHLKMGKTLAEGGLPPRTASTSRAAPATPW